MAATNLSELANSAPLLGFRISDRWGVVAEPGFQAVPDVLIFRQKDLGLSSEELNVLLNLGAHWWRPGDVVFPRASTIATRMGVSTRTVQRLLQSLRGKGFVEKGRTTNGSVYYSLEPLKEKLSPLAAKTMEERRNANHLRKLKQTERTEASDGQA